MFYNFNCEDSVYLLTIALAFDFLNDELVDVNNLIDSISEVYFALSS